MNYKKNVTIRKRLYRSYLTILGIVCLVIVVSLSVLLYSYRRMNQFYRKPYEGVKTTLSLYGDMESAEKNILKSIVLHNDYSMQYVEEAKQEFEEWMHGMNVIKEKELTSKKQYVQLNQVILELNGYIKDIVQLIEEENYEKALQLYNNQCKLLFEEGKKTLLKMQEQADTHATESIDISKWMTFASVIGCLVITAMGIVIVLFLIKKTVARIIVPIQSFVVGIEEVTRGKLDGHIQYAYDDELGDLSNHMNTMTGKLKEMIENIEETVESLNRKEYAIDIEKEYIGDFAQIKRVLNELIVTLRSMVVRMSDSSEEVLGRANQLAEISNKMAEDASGEEVAVEQLVRALHEVITQLQQNVATFQYTKDGMAECFAVSNEGKKQIDTMRMSLHHINDHYAKIETVMSMMEEFAKKTKLLALNATIESARCGSMGNGFAVVAEEIRVLAEQSREAVEEVKTFISDAVVILQEGNEIADITHHSFTHLQGAIINANEDVETIASMMKEQEMMVREVREGMEAFVAYAQKASATAQETLSASELLRFESMQLDQYVKQFKV